MAAQEQARMEQLQAVAESAPQPSEPYSTKTLTQVTSELNRLAEKAEVGVQIEWAPPEGESKWNQPLPPDLWMPIVAVTVLANEGLPEKPDAFKKLQFDPESLTNDRELTKAAGKIRQMSGDKKFVELLKPQTPEVMPPQGEVDSGAPMPPMPPEAAPPAP